MKVGNKSGWYNPRDKTSSEISINYKEIQVAELIALNKIFLVSIASNNYDRKFK